MKNIFSIFKKNKQTIGAQKFITAKTVVFIVCSVVSALINLIFISNLTKTPYNIGGLINIPAAIFLGTLSLALDASKALHVIQVNTLNELYRNTTTFKWADKIKKLCTKWTAIYILYVVLSVITSVSLSSISIGSAIRNNENTISLITEDINDLTYLKDSQKSDKSDKRKASSSNREGTLNAKDSAMADADKYWKIIEPYQNERNEFISIYGSGGLDSKEEITWKNKTIIPDNYWTNRLKDVKSQMPTIAGVDVKTTTKTNLLNQLKKQAMSFETDTKSVDDLNNQINENKTEIDNTIDALENKYRHPNKYIKGNIVSGDLVSFYEDGKLVDITKAISILKTLKNEYQSDSGDVGSSSKIFTIIADLFNKGKQKTSGFGTTEILMMAMLLFLSLLCELAINQFSPKVKISRELLGEFSQYFPKNFDVDKFMEEIESSYNKFITKDTPKIEEIKEEPKIEEIKEEPKVEEKPVIEKIEEKPKKVRKPKAKKIISLPETIEKQDEEFVFKNEEEPKKMIVKSAERELEEMLNAMLS